MLQYIVEFLQTSGFAQLQWQQSLMILISFVLIYLAIVKKYEPLLLLPIAFGMFLANLPLGGINDLPSETLRLLATVDAKLNSADLAAVYQGMLESGEHLIQKAGAGSVEIFAMKGNYGGLLYYLGRGVKIGRAHV